MASASNLFYSLSFLSSFFHSKKVWVSAATKPSWQCAALVGVKLQTEQRTWSWGSMAPSSKFPPLIMNGIQNTCQIKSSPPPPRLGSLSLLPLGLSAEVQMLRRKTLVTRNGDSPFWGPVMSSGHSEKYKHVFGSKNPGVNVTCVRMFSQLRCRGGLRFGCGPCWWVNISSRLICVTDSGPMISASRPVWHPWTRALFSAVKHSPSAGSRCFLYRICLPLVVVPTLVLFLIHAFHCPHGLREALL